ncbi:MAG: hypothetical protein ACO2O4_02910 [Minisyncoccia bacterium]|jgi:DNA polymerase III delta prime subunit
MRVSWSQAHKIIKDLTNIRIEDPMNKNRKLIIPVLLNGPTGVGKTTLVGNIREELILSGKYYNVIYMNLAYTLPENIGGIPTIIDAKEYSDVIEKIVQNIPNELKEIKRKTLSKVMDITPPSYILDAIKVPTIFFFDEYNRSKDYQRNAVMPLILERRIGIYYELHEDTIVFLAINLGEGYQTEDIDEAVLARCAILNIEADENDIEYFVKKYPIFNAVDGRNEILKIIREKQQFVELTPPYSKRNLEMALRIFQYCMSKGYDKAYTNLLLSTVIPFDLARFFEIKIDRELLDKIVKGKWRNLNLTDNEKIGIIAYLTHYHCNNIQEFINIMEFILEVTNKLNMRELAIGSTKALMDIGGNRELIIKNIGEIIKHPIANALQEIMSKLKEEISIKV